MMNSENKSMATLLATRWWDSPEKDSKLCKPKLGSLLR